MKITAVELKNALLATPASEGGKRRMGQSRYNKNVPLKQFLRDCYVEPDSVTNEKYFDKENIDLCENLDFDLFTSEGFNQEDYVSASNKRKEGYTKNKFETNLLGFNKIDLKHRTFSTIFMIEGPAGCGKTTYGLKLLQEGFDYDYLNIENATQTSFTILGESFDLSDETHPEIDPFMALQGLLIGLIHKILSKQGIDDNEHREYINNICTIYYKYFRSNEITSLDTPNYRNFFDIVLNYSKIGDYAKFGKDVCKHLKEIVNKCKNREPQVVKKDDYLPSVRSLIGIIMRLYYCISKHGDPKTKKILFLDNFERFIMSEPERPYVTIYDIHLQKILTSLYEEADRFEALLFTIIKEFVELGKDENYVTTFGIMIALREATLNQLRKNHIFVRFFEKHRAELSPIHVNLIRAFNFKKIMNKKVNYFIYNKVEETIPSPVEGDKYSTDYLVALKALNNVLDDRSHSKWGLRHFVLDMFNNNYRKFVINLIEAVVEKQENFEAFNTLWDLAKKLNESYLKNICRKLVIRSLLDYIHNCQPEVRVSGFFDDLLTKHIIGTPTEHHVKLTYFRNILSYLHNVSISNRENVSNFPSLIKALLNKPTILEEDISTKDFEDIATVLEISCETAKIKTNGDELIFINLNPYSEYKTLVDRMKQIWKMYLDSNKENNQQELNNLRITDAGSAFAMIVPCFEYFACRYKTNSVPLIMLKKEDDRKILLFGNGHFIKNTPSSKENAEDVGIVERAFICVDVSITIETDLLLKSEGKSKRIYEKPEWIYKDKDLPPAKKGMVYPLRILVEHRNYLVDCRRFLAECANDTFENSFYKPNHQGQCGVIDTAIKKYNGKITEVIKNHWDYVNLGALPSGYE